MPFFPTALQTCELFPWLPTSRHGIASLAGRASTSMADVPAEMMAHGRPADPNFEEHENLYRRFSPDKLDGDEVSIAAVALPDMSVIREKYGRPQWLLLEDEYAD